MKKLFTLLFVMLATVGMTFAQNDIYSVGCATNASGKVCAVVYHNNEKLYEKVPPLGDYNFEASSVVVVDENVYWTLNSTYSANGQPNYGDVYLNGNVYLSNPGGEDIYLSDLAYGDGHIYAAGSKTVNNTKRAVIYKDNNTTPHLLLGDGVHYSAATSMVYYNGNLYTAGWQNNGSGSKDAIIWKNGEQLYNLGNFKEIGDIAYYNHHVYTVVNTNANIKVYKDNQVLYTLTDNWNGDIGGMSICIDAGNIYVTGHVHSDIRAWKNGVMTDNLTQFDDGNALASMANHKGLYYAGYADGEGYVWRNGTLQLLLYQCDRINDFFVEIPCTESDVISLPFNEGFEESISSKWSCWTTVDADHNNGENLSFWARTGTDLITPATGQYCVSHGNHPTVNQQGWLVTPRLYLQPNRDNTTLTFKTYEMFAEPSTYEAVLVSTNSNPNNADAYTQVWTQNNPTGSWKTVTVDLSAYQGQAVYIAFKYMGVYGHQWFIDDVSVTEEWVPCINPSGTPYSQNFTGGIDGCWYIIDVDQTGGNYYWRHDETTQSVMHPYGPSGVFQKGYLYSIKIDLASGHDYVLKFKTRTQSSGANMSNKVRIALDESGVPDPSHYYTVIWTDQQFSSYWEDVEIPLTNYAGHYINICFDYEGTYAHKWYIDDFRVEEAVTQYTITANANNDAWGTVTGGGTYNAGATCTLTATPASGYQFQSWKKNGTVVSTNASYSFTVNEDATYTAYFGEAAVNYYTVTTAVNPEGAGSVSGGGTFQEGSSITLTAISNAGYMFNHWNDGNTANPRTVTVTQNVTYTAYFDMEEYTIQVYADPSYGGTVTGGGNYHYGEIAILTASPADGYEFAGWSDGNNDNPREVIVTQATYYVAVFNEVGTTYYTVGVLAYPDKAGTVEGGGTYEEGTSIVLTAVPNPGYRFTMWDDGESSNPRTVTVNFDMTFIAYFDQESYTITVNANPASGGTVSGGGSYLFEDVATLTAMPNSGYTFAGWSDGSSENPHQVTVTGNATYTATFSAAGFTYYNVTAFVSPVDAGMVTGAGTYEAGTSVTLKAIPNAGYSFSQWNDGSTANPRTVTVNNNMSFTAYFTAGQFTITTNATPEGTGMVTGGGVYHYGETAVLTAVPSANCTFMQWSDGNVNNPRTVTVTGNAIYTAVFYAQGSQMYTLTVTSNDPAHGAVYGSGIYPMGSMVDIFAFPVEGYSFDAWNDGNRDNPRSVMINGNLSFLALFKKTGVDETRLSSLSIYPNPAQVAIRLKGVETNSEVRIFNSHGALVKVVNTYADEDISIRDLASGLYLIRCGNQSLRFVKE